MTEIRNVGSLDTSLIGTELIPFQESSGGAGSTKRTTVAAIASLGGGVNVVSYGADPTGVGDSTSAIAAAIAAAGNYGKVTFPAGGYKVSDQGSGFCLDISTLNSIHLAGPTTARNNPSGQGGGATIFTTSASTKIFKAESVAINHYGPYIEDLRIEDRTGSSTIFSLARYNNYVFRNVTFRGPGGTNTSVGLSIDGTSGDASYGHIEACAFHRCLTGMTTSTSVGFTIDGHTYFNSNTPNHVLLQMSGTAFCQIIGNKFEGTSATGGVGINISGLTGSLSIIGNGFEQCVTGVNIAAPVSGTYTGVSVIGNQFTGGGANPCTGFVVGANRIRDEFISNRFSNLGTNFTDNGTDTIVIGTRTDAARTGEYMRIGGVYFGEGTAAPPAISVPDGSEYIRSGTGSYDRIASAWVLRAPAVAGNASWGRGLATYSTSITPDVTNLSLLVINVTDTVAFTINAPTGAVSGQHVMFKIRNNSGGVIGNVTWVASAGGFATTWTNASSKPASTHATILNFVYDGTANFWYQAGQGTDLAGGS